MDSSNGEDENPRAAKRPRLLPRIAPTEHAGHWLAPELWTIVVLEYLWPLRTIWTAQKGLFPLAMMSRDHMVSLVARDQLKRLPRSLVMDLQIHWSGTISERLRSAGSAFNALRCWCNGPILHAPDANQELFEIYLKVSGCDTSYSDPSQTCDAYSGKPWDSSYGRWVGHLGALNDDPDVRPPLHVAVTLCAEKKETSTTPKPVVATEVTRKFGANHDRCRPRTPSFHVCLTIPDSYANFAKSKAVPVSPAKAYIDNHIRRFFGGFIAFCRMFHMSCVVCVYRAQILVPFVDCSPREEMLRLNANNYNWLDAIASLPDVGAGRGRRFNAMNLDWRCRPDSSISVLYREHPIESKHIITQITDLIDRFKRMEPDVNPQVRSRQLYIAARSFVRDSSI